MFGTPGGMTYGNLSSQELSVHLVVMTSALFPVQARHVVNLHHGLSSLRFFGAASPTGRGDKFLLQVSFNGGKMADCQTCLAPLEE